MKTFRFSFKELFGIIVGSAIFVAGINIFITPCGLYNVGVVGIAQIIRTLLIRYLGINANFDIAGLINLALNIPLFVLAYRSMNRKFFLATLLSVGVQTLCMSLIRVPSAPILPETLACCLVGGFVCAYGIGMVLSVKASGGGMDILGLWVTLHNDKFSVGSLQLAVNMMIYLACALLFDIKTAIYSVIYSYVYSFVIDRHHLTNIEASLMIFTKNPEVKKVIMEKYVRGVTCWKGVGAYTGSEMEVLVSVVAKSEVQSVKKLVHELDPQAFIIMTEGLHVTGGYEKRLIMN